MRGVVRVWGSPCVCLGNRGALARRLAGRCALRRRVSSQKPLADRAPHALVVAVAPARTALVAADAATALTIAEAIGCWWRRGCWPGACACGCAASRGLERHLFV